MNKTFKRAPDLEVVLNSKHQAEVDKFIHSGTASQASQLEDEGEIIEPDEDMQWMATDPKLITQHIVKIPAPLKQLIMHLGDTTRGHNQTSISIEGLTYVATKMAKEQGLPLPKNWGSWLKKKK